MTRKYLFLLFILVILSGCLNKNILDSIRIVTAIGFDTADGDQYEITVVVPRFNPDKSTSSETYTTKATISKEAHLQLNMSDSKPFVSGKVETILASEDLAQEGLIDLTDGFLRDPSVGSRVFLAISEGQAKEILKGQYSNQDNGMFISDMLIQNTETGPLPKTNLHLFFNQYFGEGIDPYLPLISLKENRITISGLALMKKDKMVGKLNRDSLFTFKTLKHQNTSGDQFIINLEGGEKAVLYKVASYRKITINSPEQMPSVHYHAELNFTVREYSGVDLNPKIVKKIEKKAEEKFDFYANEMVKKFQELEIDPLGIGAQVRSRSRSWEYEKWKDQYQKIPITVTSTVTVSETGIAE